MRLFQENGYKEADINLGCPFPMQVRAHRGSGLCGTRKRPSLYYVRLRSSRIFLFYEMRWVECTDESFVLLSLLNKLPLKHITLHPRLGYSNIKELSIGMDSLVFMMNVNFPYIIMEI